MCIMDEVPTDAPLFLHSDGVWGETSLGPKVS
jgi:hypothetical protein